MFVVCRSAERAPLRVRIARPTDRPTYFREMLEPENARAPDEALLSEPSLAYTYVFTELHAKRRRRRRRRRRRLSSVGVAAGIADPETLSARNAWSLIQLRRSDVPSFHLSSHLPSSSLHLLPFFFPSVPFLVLHKHWPSSGTRFRSITRRCTRRVK